MKIAKSYNRKIYSSKNRKKLNAKMLDYRKNNYDKISSHKKTHYIKNKKNILQKVKKYSQDNAQRVKSYYLSYIAKNKEKIALRMKAYQADNINLTSIKQKNKYHTVPHIKLRKIISSRIRAVLLCSKDNKSITRYLPYTTKDLNDHLESLFEPWMNWDNHGIYNSDK